MALLYSVSRMSRFLLALFLVACGPVAPPRPTAPPPMATTCAVQLPPATASDPAAAPPPLPAPPPPEPSTARSLLVVNVEVPLASIAAGIEPKVPKRVAQERDHDIGMAGRLEYVVDRGPFALRVEGDTLIVEAPLTAQVQACAKGHCYASCSPTMLASAKVPLKLGADYKLHTSGVTIAVTRGCELHALGGLVSIDVTPVLNGALAAQAPVVAQEIDRQLPDLRGEAAKLWTEIQKPVPLPLGACLLPDAEEIVQGTASGTKDVARLRFGLVSHPEVRVKCTNLPAVVARPLPPLRHDAALPELGDVHLAVALSPEAPANALGGGAPFDLGIGRAQIASATGDTRELALTLAGEVCGTATVSAAGAAWTKRQALHLTGAAVSADDYPRLTAARIDPSMLTAGVEQGEIPLPIAIDSLADLLPELARNFKDDRVSVAATISATRPESASLRDGTTPVAVAYLHGAVTLTVR